MGLKELLAALFLSLLVKDINQIFAFISEKIVKVSLFLLPESKKDRYEEEWLADLSTIDGNFSRLIFSFSIVIAGFLLRNHFRQELIKQRKNKKEALKHFKALKNIISNDESNPYSFENALAYYTLGHYYLVIFKNQKKSSKCYETSINHFNCLITRYNKLSKSKVLNDKVISDVERAVIAFEGLKENAIKCNSGFCDDDIKSGLKSLINIYKK